MNTKWICPHCGDEQTEEKPKIYCLNCHKKAKTKHGRLLSYYATTGTIAGYRETPVEGLDNFIVMLEEK